MGGINIQALRKLELNSNWVVFAVRISVFAKFLVIRRSKHTPSVDRKQILDKFFWNPTGHQQVSFSRSLLMLTNYDVGLPL